MVITNNVLKTVYESDIATMVDYKSNRAGTRIRYTASNVDLLICLLRTIMKVCNVTHISHIPRHNETDADSDIPMSEVEDIMKSLLISGGQHIIHDIFSGIMTKAIPVTKSAVDWVDMTVNDLLFPHITSSDINNVNGRAWTEVRREWSPVYASTTFTGGSWRV
jgi:hypothetical protein